RSGSEELRRRAIGSTDQAGLLARASSEASGLPILEARTVTLLCALRPPLQLRGSAGLTPASLFPFRTPMARHGNLMAMSAACLGSGGAQCQARGMPQSLPGRSGYGERGSALRGVR